MGRRLYETTHAIWEARRRFSTRSGKTGVHADGNNKGSIAGMATRETQGCRKTAFHADIACETEQRPYCAGNCSAGARPDGRQWNYARVSGLPPHVQSRIGLYV